ncbi:MAG TPA: phosphate ABC transporter permease PstA [Acidimicrobiales bacterium]|nr:phosphate ABC transporter permease PstA [Acidimicrobiales bacterium]
MTLISSPASAGGAAAQATVERLLKSGKADLAGRIFHVALVATLATSILILGVLLVDMVSTARPVLTGRLGEFLDGSMRSQAGTSGIRQGLVGTFWIGVFVVVLAFPLGIAAAIHLEEYASGSRLTRFIDVNIRNLAGVPSVVYGILGLTIFVKALGSVTGEAQANGRTILSAGLTLAVLVLPIVIISAAEALRAVPDGLREAGFGVGATRWEVVRHHVLPYAAPGILTGTVLALARALGEAAPLILVGATTGYLTSGNEFFDLGALRERFAAMPILIATWSGRPGRDWEQVTAAAIVMLLVMVLAANTFAILLRNRFEKKRG